MKSQADQIPFSKNSIYLEGAGLGGYGSLNYERMLPLKTNLLMAVRIGLSTYNLRDYTNKFNPDLIIPLTLSGLYGNKHKLEFGIGQTISNVIRANPSNWDPERKTNLHANFAIGYRYQKKEGGLVLRCTYTPIVEFYKRYRHWGGLSVGYAF